MITLNKILTRANKTVILGGWRPGDGRLSKGFIFSNRSVKL